MAQLNFNARTVAPDQGFEVLPAGWYIAQIEATEMKPTSDGQGAYLEMQYRILDGKYVNRKQTLRLNLRNNNQQTMQIAYGQLSAICHATGVLDCVDSDLLRGIPHKIKLTVRDARTDKDTGKHYEASNEVRGWKNVNEPTDDVAPTAGGAPAGAPAGFAAAGVPPGFGAPAGPAAAAPQGWGAPAAAAPAWQPPAQPAQPPAAPAGPAPGAGGPPWGAAAAQPQPQAPAQPAQPWTPPAAPAQPAAPGAGMAPPWQR